MYYELSLDDGLVLRDVTLGPRLMAKEIGLPYYVLETRQGSGAPLSQRFELALCRAGQPRTRVINFDKLENDASKLVLEATYLIDDFPPPVAPGTTLELTQHYEFFKLRDEGGCEPHHLIPGASAQVFPCNPYKLTVNYRFSGGASGSGAEDLISLNVPQRVHFKISPRSDETSSNTVGLFQDLDVQDIPLDLIDGIPEHTAIIEDCRNPLPLETAYRVILRGWDTWQFDSYHQTYKGRVQPPGGGVSLEEIINNLAGRGIIELSCNRQEPFTAPSAGCPECAHVHWRWSNLVPGPDHGNGLPIIPHTLHDDDHDGRCDFDPNQRCDYNSDQDLDIATVRAHPGEEDPTTFGNLLDGEATSSADLVLWYSSTGYRDEDTFWIHEAFFSASYVDLAVAMVARVNGGRVAYDITVSNGGPGSAGEVALTTTDNSLHGIVVPGETDSTCEIVRGQAICRLGAIDVGGSRTVTVTYEGYPPNAVPYFRVLATAAAKQVDVEEADNRKELFTYLNSGNCPGLCSPPPPDPDDPPTEDDARIIAADVPASMTAGETRSVTVRVQNSGSVAWPAGGVYRLGAGYASNGVDWRGFDCGGYAISPTDARAFLCRDVAPGDTYEFTFDITAPPNGTSVVFSAQMVHEAVRWFGAARSWTIALAPSGSCPHGSIQARVQPDTTVDWQTALTVAPGQQFHFGAMANGSGQFANQGVTLRLLGPGIDTLVDNDAWVSLDAVGTYTLVATCGPLRDTAAIHVVTGPLPGCIAAVSDGHWRGEYFDTGGGADMARVALQGSPVMVRDDGDGFLDFDWGGDGPGAACGVGEWGEHFASRWTRRVTLAEAGVYRFTIWSDDGFRLFVDETPVLGNWQDQVAAIPQEVLVQLTAGDHTLRFEHYENTGASSAKLRWDLISGSACRPAVASDHWRAEYTPGRTPGGEPFLVRDEGTELLSVWDGGGPNACGIGLWEYSARLTRTVDLSAGAYRFYVTADDGVRLYLTGPGLDRRLVFDRWSDPQVLFMEPVDVQLDRPGSYRIELEWYQAAGFAVIGLRWDRTAGVTDVTPPTVTPSLTGVQGNAGWYLSDVQLTWQVEDPESGLSSLAGCEARTLAADTPGLAFTCTGGNGAGQATSVSVPIAIDKTPPAVSLVVVSGTLDQQGWYTSDVVVRTSASDRTSGVASCTVDQTVTGDTPGTLVHGSCTDLAGLSGDGSLLVRIRNSAPPPPAPVAHWSFDSCDGGRVPDETRSERDVTDALLSGDVTCIAGALGNAGAFDGADDYAVVPYDARHDFTGQLTIAAWVLPDTVAGERTIANKWFAPDSYGLFVQHGAFAFKVAFPDGGWGQQVLVTAPASAGVWSHVAGVFDGAAGTVKIYVNGVLEATAPAPQAVLQPSGRTLVVGSHPEWNAFAGLIDDVRLYDAVLSDEQLQQLAWRPSPPGGPASLTVRAWIDGRSRLLVTPEGVRWQHLDFAAPGREVGAREPTFVNGLAWRPVWPDLPDAENRDCRCESSSYHPIPPVIDGDGGVDVSVVRARSRVWVIQQPNADNGRTLVVEFDDNEEGSSGWYEVVLRRRSVDAPAPTPRGAWSFDQCDGGVVPDGARAVRGVTDAVLLGGVACVAEVGAAAGAFDGADDKAEVPDHPSLHMTDKLTVSAWVKPEDVTGGRTIVNRWYTLDSYGLFVQDGSFIFRVAYPDGGWGQVQAVGAPAAAGVWSHVAGVFDGSDRVVKIYVNGVLQESAPAWRSLLQQSGRPLVIGGHPDWNAFAGLIDEVRVYDAALSDAAIQALAAGGR